MRDKRTKRLISGFIAGVLLLNQMPVFTAAAEDTTLCEHHPVHEHCGYTEAVAGSPCTHDHVDCYITEEVCIHEHIDCGYSESLEENLCEHQCTEDGGCITRQLSCTHDHDDSCGYREEVKAQPCTYECLACTVQQDVTVIGIDVTTRPAKTQYVVDEALDVSGGVITVTYSDETTQTVAMTAEMVSGYNNAVACTQTLTVTYAEQTACCDIVVVPASSTESTPFLSSSDGKVVGEIMLTSKPTKTQYVVNQDELDVTGGVITVYYTDGTNSSVEMTADMVTNFDNTSVGTYWLDIVYEGKHAQYQIAILESEEKPLVMEWHLDFSKSKTIYFLNEPLDLNEVTLELTYSDGTTETINVTPDMVEGFDTSVTGEYHMVVWYGSNGYWQNYRVGTEETIRGSCGANTYWELTKAGVLTISGSGPMMHYNSEIGAPWRERSANVKNVVIEEGVTYIGYYAFSNCSNMTSIIIPSSVTRLGNDAFYGCNNLTDVYITDMAAWVSIDTRERADHPFYCNDKEKRLFLNGQLVTDVVIPDGVTYIGGRSFFHCTSIKSLTLPASVTRISTFNAFFRCSNLTDVYITDLAAWVALDQHPMMSNQNMRLFLNNTLITDLVIPSGVTKIGGSSFSGCSSIRNVSLPDTLTKIECSAFSGCTGLSSIEIPDSVSVLEEAVFDQCTNLTSVILPDSLTNIYDFTFQTCTNLRDIQIPDKVAGIHYAAFLGCKSLTSITLPGSLTFLGDAVFYNCTSLSEVTFKGNAPTFQYDPTMEFADYITFHNVKATVNYPAGNSTWTTSVMQNYGGTITWLPYSNEHTHNYVDDICTVCGELHPNYVPLDSAEWSALQVMGGRLYRMNLNFKNAFLAIGYGENIDQFDEVSRENLLQAYYKGDPSVILKDSSYYYVGSGDGGNITYTTNGKNVYVNCEDYIDLTFQRTSEKQLTVVDSNLEDLIGLVLNGADEDTSTGISCPYSETFDLAGNNIYAWSFTPQTTGQYVVSLDNLDNTNYGMNAGLKVTKAGNVVSYEYSQSQTKFSRYVYTFEAGSEYVIETQYYGNKTLSDVIIRIDKAIPPQGIRMEHKTIDNYYYPGARYGYTISAELLPWNAVGEITWESSNPGVSSIDRSDYLDCYAHYNNQTGVTVITASCGEFRDSTVVTIKSPIQLELNVPYEDVCVYDQSKRYIFTAEEAGKYHINIDSDIVYYIYSDEPTLESADNNNWFATLEKGKFICFVIDGPTSASDQSEYTITVGNAAEVTEIKLDMKPVYGNGLQAEVLFQPKNSMEEIVSWELSDERMLQLSAAGGPVRNWHILDNGEVTITVTSKSGLTASRTIVFGACEKNICWMIDEEGTLTITGSGSISGIVGKENQPWYAFSDRIKKVVIEDGITGICQDAFMECDNLIEVIIPDTLETINALAFFDCGSLQSITLPTSLKRLEMNVFAQCTSLTQIIIPKNVEVIESQAFMGCSNLSEITIPESVKTIGGLAFADCTNLKTVVFEGDPPAIHEGNAGQAGSFYNCELTAYYHGDNEKWTKDVKLNYGGKINWKSIQNRIEVDASELGAQTSAWIDGVQYSVEKNGDICCIQLPEGAEATNMITYSYHVGDSADIHTQYPVSMKVWILKKQDDGNYTATRVEELDDILQYAGSSIRITGNKGIRMITSVPSGKRSAMISDNLAGYKLMEYGTVLSWASDLAGGQPLVLGQSYAKSNYAYKRGVADPIFAYSGNLIQYTNVLVGFTNDQCKDDIAMRPYMILEDAEGKQVTIYGGIVYRSIGYIAYQNRSAFTPGSAAYNYVWDIIHHVYGDQYDKDYKG